jgi:hypothetical protein
MQKKAIIPMFLYLKGGWKSKYVKPLTINLDSNFAVVQILNAIVAEPPQKHARPGAGAYPKNGREYKNTFPKLC